jgi:hypothetical protein
MNHNQLRNLARELAQLREFIEHGIGRNYDRYSRAGDFIEQQQSYGRHVEDKVVADFMLHLPTVMELVREGEELGDEQEERTAS